MTKALNIFAVTKTTNKKDGKSSNYPFDGLSLRSQSRLHSAFVANLGMAVPLLLPRTKRRLAPRTRQRENARCRLSQRGTRRSRYVYVPIRMVPQVRHGTLGYGLMHPTVWQVSPDVASMAVQCEALKAHPKMGIAALRKNAPVLVYPGGAQDVFRPHHLRDKIYFAGRKGFIKLALREEVPIVPIISHGAHDTLIVLADLYEQVKQLHEWGMPWLLGIDPVVFPVYLGLPWGLSIGPLPNLPLPVQIRTRVCEPIVFERYGSEAARDRDYVDACFERVTTQMQEQLDCLAGK